MFFHNFKYTLKILFQNKMLLFWTYAFPIILGTFFMMAFSNIEKSETLDIIDIAIVDNEEFRNNILLKNTFDILGDSSNENYLFDIEYVDEDTAKTMLAEEDIVGYIVCSPSLKVVVKQSGVNETILKQTVESVETTGKMVTTSVLLESSRYDGATVNYDELVNKVINEIDQIKVNIKDTTGTHMSYTMIEFYTLIAMTCLYGGILGMAALNYALANMSHTGKRISISPVHRLKLLLGSIAASYVTQVVGLLLLFIYTIFVLNVDYGNHLPQIILLALVGSFAGLSLGIMVAAIIKANDNVKTGIVISITMLGCFLSGMMGITMKYVIDTNIPILNILNPANMITDGFYSLYYYDTMNHYYFDVISLLIFSFIMILISQVSLRRQAYDSI